MVAVRRDCVSLADVFVEKCWRGVFFVGFQSNESYKCVFFFFYRIIINLKKVLYIQYNREEKINFVNGSFYLSF